MGYVSRTSKILLSAIAALTCTQSLATPITYEITFTQTWLAHDPATPGYAWLGPRLLTGQLSIDDSVLGPSNANTTYSPSSPELQAINSYTVTLDSKVYLFDQGYSSMVVAPPFSTIVRTDANGDIVDLQGAFKLPGTLSTIFLGRDGWEGTYIDIQQTDPFNSANVSGGTYAVSLVSSVPEPNTALLFGFGLIGLSAAVWRRKTSATG
jgi:hypothetical protein